MRVFITGGTGFIGNHVVEKLKDEGYDLFLLTQYPKKITSNNSSGMVKIILGNLSNINAWKDELKKVQPDIVIHMAWEGLPDYSSEISVKNLRYGLDLIRVLAEIGCTRIICTGSCWEYGRQYGKLHEYMPVNPINAFTAAKNALHWLGKEIAKENNMQFIWTRLFYVYGPGQRETSLIPYIIDCVRKGKKPEIKTPYARNDFVFVEDIAEAISMLTKNCKQSEVYNIGSRYSTSVQDIIKIVCDNYDFQYQSENVTPHQISESFVDFWADISRIHTDVGWTPETNIQDGIKKTINYYEKISTQ